jgi:TIGR03009 family protein
MRYLGLALGFSLLFVNGAIAQQGQQPQNPGGQQPPARAPLPELPPNPRLDSLLAQWEAKMSNVKSLQAEIAREDQNKVWKTREVYVGKAYFQAPNLARLDLVRQDNPSIYERFVCTGQFTYQFVPAQKEVRVYNMGLPKKGQPGVEDNFLSFLVGMKAEDAKRRYQIRLAGEDVNYIYLEVKPRFAADAADFSLAQIALTQKTYLPRMLVYTEANGNSATWNIPKLECDVQINRNYFAAPQTPPGFQLKRMPAVNAAADANGGGPSRVMRQQGQNP